MNNNTYIVQLGGNDYYRSSKTRELLSSFSNSPTVILTGLTELSNSRYDYSDHNALDTLGNFIHTRKWIEKGSLVYLVTDRHHLFRCLGLARIVWGRDVQVIPCVEGVEGGSGHESFAYTSLDWFRAVIWKLTRITVVRQPKLMILIIP